MDTSNFDLTQTAFLFSWLSNSAVAKKGTAVELADLVYEATFSPDNEFSLLSQYSSQLPGGDWQRKWGPGLFENKPSPTGHADNTALVAYSPSLDTYIVAVAGTNTSSPFDAFTEDANVGEQVTWKTFDPTGSRPEKDEHQPDVGQISRGTAIGVWALASQLVLCTEAQNSGDNNTLAGFLQGIEASGSTRVIFTGHSLGGALAPTFARWFLEQNNKNEIGNVRAVPIAGPAVGNLVYQDDWNGQFAADPVEQTNDSNQVKVWNTNVAANQDVVPHAWVKIHSHADKTDGFYFVDVPGSLDFAMDSPMGRLVGHPVFRELIVGLQAKGEKGAYVEARKLPIDVSFPLNYLTHVEGERVPTQLPEPPARTTHLETFFGHVALVHLWSYGQDAFNIDLSVFDNIEKWGVTSASEAPST